MYYRVNTKNREKLMENKHAYNKSWTLFAPLIAYCCPGNTDINKNKINNVLLSFVVGLLNFLEKLMGI